MQSHELLDAIERIAADPGKKNKEALVKEYAEHESFRRVLDLALNPFKRYYIDSLPTVTGHAGGSFGDETWELLERLRTRQLSGGAARTALLQELQRLDSKSADLLGRIVRKDLRAGFSESTVNKAVPKLLPEFAYMRCSLPTEVDLALWPWADGVYSQEKADGMFANVDVTEGGAVTITTRQGTLVPLEPLGSVVASITATLEPGYQYHGEIVVERIVENTWTPMPREDSNGRMNSILKGGEMPPGHRATLQLWDRVPLVAVAPKARHAEPYKQRLAHLRAMIDCPGAVRDQVGLVPMKLVYSQEGAYAHCEELLLAGKEGTVVKHPDGGWGDHTSKHQVKLKIAFEVELRVRGFNEADVTSKNRDTFGSIEGASECGRLIVNVTGFSDKERAEIHARRDELLNTVMTVRANSIMASDKEGKPHSLFLPRHVEFRADKVVADTYERIVAQYEAAKKGPAPSAAPAPAPRRPKM